MAFHGDAPFTVVYSGAGITDPDPWNGSFKRLEWHQSCTSVLGHAEHVFQAKKTGEPGGDEYYVKILDDLLGSLKEGTEVVFKIVPLAGSGQGIEQHHIVKYRELVTNPISSGYELVVYTVPMLALADRDHKNKARSGSKVSDMVRTILGDYPDLTIGDVEDCGTVTEFAKLRQANLTDYEFICSQLLPRATNGSGLGSYELSTTDGKTVRFCTLPYKTKDYKVPTAQVLTVTEPDQSLMVSQNGGSKASVISFDHYRKKIINVDHDPGFIPDLGSDGPTYTGKRVEYVPLQSQDAAKVWLASRHDQYAPQTFEFTVRLKGDPDGFPVPMKLDLSDSGFRQDDQQKGLVSHILHVVRSGVYTATVTARRPKMIK